MRRENIIAAIALAGGITLFDNGPALAAVSLTGAAGGTNISADTAATAPSPGWTTLGPVTLLEGATGDFAPGTNVTLVLKAPVGFQFNTAVVPDVTFTAGGDLTSASVAMTSSATITLTLTVAGAGSVDSLTLGSVTGIQVQPTTGSPLAAGNHIYRPSTGGGTATITGISTSADGSSGSNFGSLTEVPGVASELGIATQPSASAVAGQLFGQQPVIWIEDQFGNLRSSDTLTVTAARNAGSGTLLGTTNITAVGGIATFTNLAHPLVSSITITFTSGSLASATSQTVSVTAGPFSQLQLLMPGEAAAPGTLTGKTGSPSARVAATAFTVTVNAVDGYWNLVVTNDTVSLTSSDTNATLPGVAALVNGTHTFSVTFKTSGSQAVTASDVTNTGIAPGNGSAAVVKAGAFKKLQLLVPGEIAAAGSTAGKTGTPSAESTNSPLTVTVNGVDANWNLINTNDTVRILSSDPNAVLPANAALVAGTRTFSVTLMTLGTATITASNATHTGITANTSPAITVTTSFITNTTKFAYPNRDALLADGWTFWATNNGVGRNTEITDTNVGAVVQYEPPDNPAVLRIPVDVGTILETANNSRNSLFRSLATNWVSLRLALTFSPTNNWQDAHLDLYQDDDDYLSVHHRFSGNERVGMAVEGMGLVLSYHAINVVLVTATNMTLRLDRDPVTDRISSFYSLDGTNWLSVSQFSAAFPNPRVGIVAGDSSGGFADCDLIELDVVTQTTPVTPALVVEPQHLVFNCIAGQPCTNLQVLNAVLQCRQSSPVQWTLSNSAPAWLSTSVTTSNTPGSCDVSVNPAGLAAGTYQGVLAFSAPGATSAVSTVTLIVNPATRVTLAPWQGGKSGAMSVTVDDSYPTAFDDLSTNGLRGSYVMWQDTAPAFYPAYYQAGMELGSHTLSHPCVVEFAPAMRGEIEGNIAGLVATTPEPQAQVIYFAWPCGVHSIDEEVVAADYFLVARDYNVNTLEDPSPYDFMRLKSFNSHEHDPHLYNPSAPPNPADLKTEVDAAIAQGKWFNMVLHSVNDDDGAIVYSVGKDLWMAPVGSVGKYIVQRERTVITNYVASSSYIQFGYYRLALDATAIRSFETAIGTNDFMTFKVDTTGLAQVSALFVNGVDSAFTNNGSVLYFNAPVTTNLQNIILDLQPNTAPVLAAQPNRTVNELTTLVVTNTATDADLPAQTLYYTLLVTNTSDGSVQTNAGIDANGIITWTPTTMQGPGTYVVTTVVTDFATPPLSATNSFTVTVNEVNMAPVLPSLPNVTIDGTIPLTVTNTATDADWPVPPLSYVLLVAPANAVIDPNGIITWAPPATQTPSTNTFTTVVTDSDPSAVNAKQLSATNTFIVTVFPNPLLLPAQTNRTINELTTLVVSNTATVSTNWLSSGWLATNTIWFNYPDRASLLADGWSFWATNNGAGRNTEATDPNSGVIAYAQTNASLGVVMRVPCGLGDLWSAASNNTTNSIFRAWPTNGVSARLSLGFQPTGDYEQAHLVYYQDDDNYLEVGFDYNSGEKIVFVREIQGQPVLLASVGTAATVASLRLDLDPVAGTLSALYSLDNTNWTLLGQSGQALTNVRLGVWVGGSTLPYSSTHVVCDLSRLDLVLTNLTEPMVYTLAVTNTLDNSVVTNAAIDGNGVITWTPTEAQGPGVYTFTISVVDNRVPVLFATNYFTVTVNEVNTPPVLTVPANTNIMALTAWSAQATATDADIPANPLTFALVSGPAGLTVTTNGWITWTPDSTQGASTNTVVISVTDTNPWAVNATSLSVTGSFEVVVGPVLTVAADNQTKPYGAAIPDLTGTLLGVQAGDQISATYSTVATAGSPVGTYAIVPVLHDPDGKLANYVVFTTNGTLTVTPAALVVVANNASRVYGATNPVLSGTLTGLQNGDNISASYSTTATVSSPVGSYAITPTLADPSGKLGNYNVSSTNGTLSVTAAGLVVVANNALRVYGATNPVLSGTITGLQNGDNISASYSTTATVSSPVGSYAITPTLADPSGKLGNYNVSSTNGTLSVTAAGLVVAANNASRVYGATNPVFSGTITGIQNGDNISASYSTTATVSSPVGSYAITPTLADPSGKLGNYTVSSTNGTLSVTAAGLVVAANNASRVYGATNPVFSGTITGIQNGDNISASYSTTATVSSPVGSYAITPTLADPSGKLGNYTVSSTNGTLSVTAAGLVVAANNASRVYGATNPVFSGTITGIQNGDNISASYSTTATVNSPVGSYPITPTLADPSGKLGNYTVSSTNGTLSVTAAGLVVAANNASRVYGATNPVFSGTITGIQNGDNITASYSTTATVSSPVGSYPITPTLADPGGKLGNYTVSSTNGTLSVTAAGLVVAANNASRGYGATNPVFSGTITGIQNGDNISASYSTTATVSSPVGSYPITPTLADPGGKLGNLGNYVVFLTNGTLTVTAAGLTVTASNATRAYGYDNPPLSGTITGLQNNDNITGDYTTTATLTSPVGNYGIVPTLLDPDGKLGNYTLTTNYGTLTITPVSLLVCADNLARVYGAPNPPLTGRIYGLESSVGNSLSVTCTTPATISSPVGTYPIIPSLVVPDGALSNFTVTLFNGTLKVAPSNTPVILSLVKADTNVVITWTSISSEVYRVQSKPTLAGTNWTDLAPDVTATTNTASYTDPAGAAAMRFYRVILLAQSIPLLVTADSAWRSYGSTNPAFSGTITGLQSGDNITATYVTTATPATGVGSYPITPVLADPDGKLARYTLTIVTGALTVMPAPLAVTASNVTRPYGYDNPPLSGTIAGLQNNDNITGRYTTTATLTSPVANYSIVPTLLDPGAKLPNYTVTTNYGTLTITPVSLLVCADNLARVYGAPNPPLTGQIYGLESSAGSSLSVTCATTATISSPVGTYPIIPSLVDPSGAFSNYTVTLFDGTLTVVAVNTPIIISVVKPDTGVVVTWTSISNDVYRVQYSPSPAGTNWTDLAPDVTATGSTTSFTNDPGAEPQRFYRIRLLP